MQLSVHLMYERKTSTEVQLQLHQNIQTRYANTASKTPQHTATAEKCRTVQTALCAYQNSGGNVRANAFYQSGVKEEEETNHM